MTEQFSLALIAISTGILALFGLAACLLVILLTRRLTHLIRRLQTLTEEAEKRALPVLEDVRGTVRAVAQIATLGSRVARPMMLASSLAKKSPRWVGWLTTAAALAYIGREILSSSNGKDRDRTADRNEPGDR